MNLNSCEFCTNKSKSLNGHTHKQRNCANLSIFQLSTPNGSMHDRQLIAKSITDKSIALEIVMS